MLPIFLFLFLQISLAKGLSTLANLSKNHFGSIDFSLFFYLLFDGILFLSLLFPFDVLWVYFLSFFKFLRVGN